MSKQILFYRRQRAIYGPLLILMLGSSCTNAFAQDDAPWWKSIFNGKSAPVESASQYDPIINGVLAGDKTTIDDPDSSQSNGPIGEELSALERVSDPIPRQVGSYELQSNAHIGALDSAWMVIQHPVQGYRVQLYLGTLLEARKVRSQMRMKTDLPIYLSSLAPSYRVTLGDFHDKWTAEKERQRWSETFRMTIVIPMEISISSAQFH